MKERKIAILGKKVGMTTVYDAAGVARGVTVLQLGPNVVLGKKSIETDGYNALQIGYDQKPERKINKSEEGRLKKAGGNEKARRFVREIRVSAETLGKYELGADYSLADLDLKTDDKVDVQGRSIGKGFAGVMKRWNFRGSNRTHDHEVNRHGGSIGCRKYPGRVFKGQKMAGHMGDNTVTAQNLKVVDVRTDDNVLLVRGAVPGCKNGYVTVRLAIKKNPLP